MAPAFVKEAVEPDGSLKETGACIVKAQIEHTLSIELATKKAFKADISWVKTSNDHTSTAATNSRASGAGTLLGLVALLALLSPCLATDPMLCTKEALSRVYDLSTFYTSCLTQL